MCECVFETSNAAVGVPFVCRQPVRIIAEKAEPSETPWHTDDGTPIIIIIIIIIIMIIIITAWFKSR